MKRQNRRTKGIVSLLSAAALAMSTFFSPVPSLAAENAASSEDIVADLVRDEAEAEYLSKVRREEEDFSDLAMVLKGDEVSIKSLENEVKTPETASPENIVEIEGNQPPEEDLISVNAVSYGENETPKNKEVSVNTISSDTGEASKSGAALNDEMGADGTISKNTADSMDVISIDAASMDSIAMDEAMLSEGVSLEKAGDLGSNEIENEGESSLSMNYQGEGWYVEEGNYDPGYFAFPEDTRYKLMDETYDLPAKYSSVEQDLVTGPKNQTNSSYCWAYTSASMAESSIIKYLGGDKEKTKVSAVKLVDQVFKPDGSNNLNYADPLGLISPDHSDPASANSTKKMANVMYSTFAMASWAGPVESDSEDQMFMLDNAHLENAYWIPINDVEAIKNAIQEFGSVGIGVRFPVAGGTSQEYGINSGGYKYYPVVETANHAVTLVGWDDSIPADRFANVVTGESPSSTGGFIAKNSYGTEWGNGGYFYISYEDCTFKADVSNVTSNRAVAFEFGDKGNYDNNYQYDGTVCNFYTALYSAYNVFKIAASNVEEIKAIGVALVDTGDYKASIYHMDSYSKAPQSQTLLEEVDFTVTYPGYLTIPLPEPMLVKKGEIIGVVIEKPNPENEDKLIPYDIFVDETGGYRNSIYFYNNTSTVSGQSFVKKEMNGNYYSTAGRNDGTFIKSAKPGYTPRIKLFTDDSKKSETNTSVHDAEITLKLSSYVESFYSENYKTVVNRPTVEVYSKGKFVSPGFYNKTFINDNRAGIASVVVQGDGYIFTGKISQNYKVISDKLKINQDVVVYGVGNVKWDASGNYVFPNMVVKYREKNIGSEMLLYEGKDYVVSYVSGNNTPNKKQFLYIYGRGSFEDKNNKGKKSEKKIKVGFKAVDGSMPMTDPLILVGVKYNGKYINEWSEIPYKDKAMSKPEVEVYDADKGTVLTDSNQYKVTFDGYKTRGAAKITIKGRGRKVGYTGRKVFHYDIEREDISDAKLSVTYPKDHNTYYAYTGKTIEAKIKVKLDGKTLPGSAYYVRYINNKEKSSDARAYIYGRGQYRGCAGYISFKIS